MVENIGIERTFQKMQEAKIVVWVTDTPPTGEETREMQEKAHGKKLIQVANKLDLLSSPDSQRKNIIHISAKQGINIDLLEQALVNAADIPEITENDVIVTSARHYEALLRANASLSRVLESMDMGLSGDLIAEDLKIVLEELGEITGGQINSQETLNNIFKHFCIGK